MSPEVPSEAFRASYPSYYQEAVASGSGSFWSVGCGPFPATVGFHPFIKADSTISSKWELACQVDLF